MQGWNVIVVVVRSAAMSSIFIQFTEKVSVVAAIIKWIEDRYAVNREGDGTT